MAFTYAFGANPIIDFPRLLCSDTDSAHQIFQDSEILAFYQICQAQFQSSMYFTQPNGANLPASPVSYLRVAAFMLDSLASNQSRLASVIQLLDVKLDASKAALALRTQAQSYRDTDDNAGAFAIIEQVRDEYSFQQRFWNQVQRQFGTT